MSVFAPPTNPTPRPEEETDVGDGGKDKTEDVPAEDDRDRAGEVGRVEEGEGLTRHTVAPLLVRRTKRQGGVAGAP